MSKTYRFDPATLERCRREYYPEASQTAADEVSKLMKDRWSQYVARLKEADRRKALPRGALEVQDNEGHKDR